MKKIVFLLLSFVPGLLLAQNLDIDASNVIARVPSLIYGAGAEDVNHEIYGGLYDQRIFGEGFEEPTTSNVEGWSQYDEKWTISDDMLQIVTSKHGKIIYDGETLTSGTISVDVRLDSASPIAGFIFNVSSPGTGGDTFNGYEVALNGGSRTFVYGKHRQNWTSIANNPVTFDPAAWNNLRIEFDGAKATVYLNGQQVFTYNDTSSPLKSGKVGLRSYGGSASFRNLKINDKDITFKSQPSEVANFVQFDNLWQVNDGILQLTTNGHGKIIYQGPQLERGSCEVEVRLDGSRPIAGFIIDVQEPGTGADRFRGYEVALDCDDRTFVFGKHDNNWQPIANFAVSFSPKEWNLLRVEFDGRAATVYLNGKKIYSYTDDSATPLMYGKVGLRSFDGPASFRNLKINDVPIHLAYAPIGVSKIWEAVGQGTFEHDATQHLTGQYSQKLSGQAGTAVANKGLNKWGIALTEGQPMQGCVYLKGDAQKAFVALQNIDGSVEYARQELTGVGAEWQRFAFTLTPDATDSLARFVVGLASEGTLWADQAMLYTDSYPFRSDLTEAFRQQGLTFLRYGGTMVNAAHYMTKNMIGNRELREPYTGHWYAHSTNGFAIPEFVEFARLIGAEPTFAINIEDNPADVLALLKEIEPYHLHYIEIGNEENIGTTALSAYKHYVERFLTLYDAIHAVYPDLKFINAAWWRPDDETTMKYVFDQLDGKCDYWDYHPWTETFAEAKAIEAEIKNMQALFLKWNPATAMRCAILEENGNTHDMARALAHAEMLNIVRRMDGFVAMDSPANALQPYMQNDNGWDQGQIFFSPSSTWNQPPYYAQQIAARTHQPLLVGTAYKNASIDITATRNQAGDTLVVHVVNSLTSTRIIKFNLNGFGQVQSLKSYAVHATDIHAENTPQQPRKIFVREEELSPTATQLQVRPNSYTAFVFVRSSADAIHRLDAKSHSADIYDLQGRRLSSVPNGIYIRSGKKELRTTAKRQG